MRHLDGCAERVFYGGKTQKNGDMYVSWFVSEEDLGAYIKKVKEVLKNHSYTKPLLNYAAMEGRVDEVLTHASDSQTSNIRWGWHDPTEVLALDERQRIIEMHQRLPLFSEKLISVVQDRLGNIQNSLFEVSYLSTC